MKTFVLQASITGLTLGSAVPLLAQSQQDSSAKPAPSTQNLMASNGGSLLQAADPQQKQENADPNKKDDSFNFYAIETPAPRLMKKHDLVNIVVNEESKSQSTGNSDQQRASDFDAKVDAFVKFNLAKLSVQGGAEGAKPPEIKLEGTRDFKGQGEYDRDDTMTTRMEAEVIDVKPNGTLVLESKRTMQIDEEEISVTLTGECRVADVDATNSVLSTDLYDMNLKKQTKGEVHDTAKRGLLHRILDILNPF